MLRTFKQIGNIIQHRSLLWNMVVRDLKVRYRTPFLGFLWAILVPLCQIFILKIVFSFIVKVPLENFPFFIFLMTGVFPWRYFDLSVTQATESIVANAPMIKKANFPHEIMPISVVISNLIHFMLALVIALFFLAVFKVKIPALVFCLPLLLLFHTLLCIGLALAVSSLQVCFRDLKYGVEIVFMGWFYLTPIFYPLSLVADISGNFLKIYLLNPVVALVTLYRLLLLKGYAGNLPAGVNLANLIFAPLITCIVIFFFGFWTFRKCQPKFFDLI